MRSAIFLSLPWLFIFAAAVFDCWFAWNYRTTFAEWELNPLARWAAAAVGLPSVFAFKFAGLAFAMALAWHYARRRCPLGPALTAFAACTYAVLVAHYVVGYHSSTPAAARSYVSCASK